MKTTVLNLLDSKQKDLFVNNLLPDENIISLVIIQRKQTGLLLDREHRNKIKNELNIISKISANGENIAFCESLNLFARQYKN